MKSSNSQTQVSLHTRTDMRLSKGPSRKLSSVCGNPVLGVVFRVFHMWPQHSLPCRKVRVRDCCWDNVASCFFVWVVRCASPAL